MSVINTKPKTKGKLDTILLVRKYIEKYLINDMLYNR